jgi:hypothetical protein
MTQAALPAQHGRRDDPSTPSRAELGDAESALRRYDRRQQGDPLEILFVDRRMLDVDGAPVVDAFRVTEQQPVPDVRSIETALESRLGPTVVVREFADAVRHLQSVCQCCCLTITEDAKNRAGVLAPPFDHLRSIRFTRGMPEAARIRIDDISMVCDQCVVPQRYSRVECD